MCTHLVALAGIHTGLGEVHRLREVVRRSRPRRMVIVAGPGCSLHRTLRRSLQEDLEHKGPVHPIRERHLEGLEVQQEEHIRKAEGRPEGEPTKSEAGHRACSRRT